MLSVKRFEPPQQRLYLRKLPSELVIVKFSLDDESQRLLGTLVPEPRGEGAVEQVETYILAASRNVVSHLDPNIIKNIGDGVRVRVNVPLQNGGIVTFIIENRDMPRRDLLTVTRIEIIRPIVQPVIKPSLRLSL